MATSRRRNSRRLRANNEEDDLKEAKWLAMREKWRTEASATVARLVPLAMPLILAEISTIYKNYAICRAAAIQGDYARRVREPSITAAYLREALPPRLWAPGTSVKEQNRVIYAALSKLVKAGKLEASIGVGDHGKEARCYEPA
jgi:hypothetical protein